MEEAMFVAGSCWLEDVVKALEEERDNGLGCMVSAASAVEVVAFSTTLYAEYPSGKDYKRNKIKFLLTTKYLKDKISMQVSCTLHPLQDLNALGSQAVDLSSELKQNEDKLNRYT